MPEPEKDRTGQTWLASLPCPTCGRKTVIGYLLVNEEGKHMHTHYVCTFWPKNPPGPHKESVTRPCGWHGWKIPGWDMTSEETVMGEPVDGVGEDLITITVTVTREEYERIKNDALWHGRGSANLGGYLADHALGRIRGGC